jgi:hypothetical protein
MKAKDFNDAWADGDGDAEFDGVHEAANDNGAPENDPLRNREAVRISSFIRDPWPAMRWVIKNCLPLGILGLIAAQGGVGKSRLIIQLAFCLALGRRFLDTWDIGEPGASLLLFAEDDRNELHRRFGKLAQATNLSQDEMELFDERVHVASVVDQDNYITNKNADGDVQETDYPERIVRLAKEIPDLKLIVIDPLSCFRGGDENDAIDTTRFVVSMRRLVKETDATILMVHHTNKNSARNGDFSQHSARGSSALTDGVRFQAGLFPKEQDQSKETKGLNFAPNRRYAKFAVTKNNYAQHQDDIWVTTDDNGVLVKAIFDPGGKCVSGAGEANMGGANILKLMHQEAQKDRFYSKSQFASKFSGKRGPLGRGRDAILRALDEQIDEGWVFECPPDKPTRGLVQIMKLSQMYYDLETDADLETEAEYRRQKG